MRLTWKREPRETGLAAICQGERGFHLNLNGINIGSVSPLYKGFGRDKIGYYWCVGSAPEIKLPYRNTANRRPAYATVEEAKEACKAYVLECLESAKK